MMDDPRDPERPRQRQILAPAAAAEKVVEIAAQYRACFASPAGRLVLADLQRCYQRSTIGRSPRQTELRAAQRDVLLRIEDLLTVATEEPGQAVRQLRQANLMTTNLLEPWSSYER